MSDTPNWDELREVASTRDASLSELVVALDLAWVASVKLGVELSEDGGRLVGRCPFHDDERPSFAIFWPEGAGGKARWGCWSCADPRGGVGVVGDVLDLVARWKGVGIVAAIGYARVLLREFEHAGSPAIERARYEDTPREIPLETRNWFNGALRGETAGMILKDFASRRGWATLNDHDASRRVAGAFDLRYAQGFLLAPYYDDAGVLVALKSRLIVGSGTWRASRGSRLGRWYAPVGASFEEDRSCTVVICEGESDCWTAWYAGYDVRGLPAGASSARTTPVDVFNPDRRAVIALDGDEAGRGASDVIAKRLRDAGAQRVEILDLPDGQDVASMGASWLVAQVD